MGGYAGYVWGSVGACAVAMALESWLLRRRHRRLVQTLRRRGRAATGPAAPRTAATTRGEGQAA